MKNIGRHNEEIQRNLRYWEEKPSLRRIYKAFYELIAENVNNHSEGLTVELGSSIGNIKEVIPHCIRTDLFANPWIDRIENAYSLSFTDASLSDLILSDVFHHLKFPGTALDEFHRVLMPSGRVIIFEPYVSVLGFLVFGLFHDEPLGMNKPIQWFAPPRWSAGEVDYYAAQGNASRIFLHGEFKASLNDWEVVKIKRLSAISYVASGATRNHNSTRIPLSEYCAFWIELVIHCRLCLQPDFLSFLKRREAREGHKSIKISMRVS